MAFPKGPIYDQELIHEHQLRSLAPISGVAAIMGNTWRTVVGFDPATSVIEEPKVKQLSPAEAEIAVEEIEKDFKESENVILKDIDEILEREVDSDLASLAGKGFAHVPGVTKAINTEKMQLDALERAELIEKYHKRYPGKIFITENYLNELCEKHGLVFAKAIYFIGEIPKENVKEIAEFRVLDEDCPVNSFISMTRREKDFKIVAPPSQFKKEGLQQVGHELKEIPDPIVLAPVRGGFLIVSMWGPEKEIIEKRNE
jgi:hypothetical protein